MSRSWPFVAGGIDRDRPRVRSSCSGLTSVRQGCPSHEETQEKPTLEGVISTSSQIIRQSTAQLSRTAFGSASSPIHSKVWQISGALNFSHPPTL